MIYFKIDSPDFYTKARFVFETLFNMAGLDARELRTTETCGNDDIQFYYGSEPPQQPDQTRMVFIKDGHYRPHSPLAADAPMWFTATRKNVKTFGIEKIPSLFRKKITPLENCLYARDGSVEHVITHKGRHVYCGADVIATAFYLLNLKAETQTSQRDLYGRYHKKYSRCPEIYDRPVIEQYVKLLQFLLSILAPGYKISPIWPNGHTFALALSHDVDRLNTWTLRKAKRAILNGPGPVGMRGKICRGCNVVKSALRPDNWRGNFPFIVELEKKFAAESTFFFAVQHRVPRDPQFHFTSNHIKKCIRHLKQNGASVALHGSLSTAFNGPLLADERRVLENTANETVLGTRQHYLKFDPVRSWPLYEKYDFMYDSSAGFASETGYRCGTGFPYYPYNDQKKSAFHFLEIPLLLMDSIFLLDHKLYKKKQEAWQIIQHHLEMAKMYNSCLTLNWHNNNTSPGDVTGNTDIYLKILQWTSDQNGWICSLENLAKYWRNKFNENA